ncbi:MAG: hypothetical protein J6L86_00610 [Alphaproteobacteria bacterium]|nr:hypothetical protein [Alphaproteobacteria bacterium]MBQ8630268.1 hypothetical protein [Alphaproteobacteria bacterium]
MIRVERKNAWTGRVEIAFNYNLKVLLAILALIIAVLLGYGLFCLLSWSWNNAVVPTSSWIWNSVLVPTAAWLWKSLWWILGILLGGLLLWWAWTKNIFRNLGEKVKNNPKTLKAVLLVLLGLAVLLCVIILWPNPKPVSPVMRKTTNKVMIMLPRTAIARAYLDKEENLLGCKYIFGEKAKSYMENRENNLTTFKVVSEASWIPEVDALLAPEVKGTLSDDEIAVITLVAMRNGYYGFKESDFLKVLNKEGFDKAVDAIKLHRADGASRKLKDEGKIYTWMLWALGKGYVTFEELWNSPTWAYLKLNADELYQKDKRVFKSEFKEIILGKGCNNQLVRNFNFFEGRDMIEETTTENVISSEAENSLWNKICSIVYPAKKWLHSLFGVEV